MEYELLTIKHKLVFQIGKTLSLFWDRTQIKLNVGDRFLAG
jgi:hypothetical protein